MGIQLPRVILSTTLPTSSFNPSPEQPLEKSIDWEKRMEALDELERWIQILEDLKSRQNFQVTYPYSIFQGEHDNLEKSIKTIIHCQNDPLDMIEAKLSRLENTRRNKKTVPTQSLNIVDTSSYIEENQESWYPENFDQDSISPQNLELDQYQPIDKLVSFHFNELEVDYECEPNP